LNHKRRKEHKKALKLAPDGFLEQKKPTPLKTIESMKLADLRRQYTLETLSETEVRSSPIEQFALWFEETQTAQLIEPNAMTLATADAQGRPSARTVLLKDFSPEGFTFFTNYESHKGRDLQENPWAALLFTWLELERQVRIEGEVTKIDPAVSRAYFQSRPRESQLGAWASPQSRVVGSREELEARFRAVEQEYEGIEALPLPPFWGGYLLRPHRVEFWQGRPNRLHDRVLYRLDGRQWTVERLAP
jgi:pyridoxamine 5'-phosphate oxidase